MVTLQSKLTRVKVLFKSEEYSNFFIELIDMIGKTETSTYQQRWDLRYWVIDNSPIESFNDINSIVQPQRIILYIYN